MSSGTVYTPGTAAANWVNQVWANTVDRGAYEKARVYPKVTKLDAPHKQGNLPLHDNLAVSTQGESTGMDEPVFTANTESVVTYTPGTISLNISIDERTIARMMLDPRNMLRQSIEMAMAQKVDQDMCSTLSGFSTNQQGSYASDLTLANILGARSQILAGAKEYAEIGQFLFFYHHAQDDTIMQIAQLTQWTVRGAGEAPAKSGLIGEGYGIQFQSTGNIYNPGSGYANVMFIERAAGIGFNIKPRVKAQEHGAGYWLIGMGDYGRTIVRNAYGVLLKSGTA